MPKFGRSIRIFLADGSPAGLRHVEIANWSGQTLACPRSRFSELADWEESKRPGVYFLFERASVDENSLAYIGESEETGSASEVTRTRLLKFGSSGQL